MSARSRPLRIAALISGGGTNVWHLMDEIEAGRLDAEIVGVIASRPQVPGLARARERGIDAVGLDRRRLSAEAFQDAIHAALDTLHPDLVACCGFLSRFELRGYAGRTLNIHPALIPAFSGQGFYGRRVHEAVLESGVKLSGVTVHFCDEEYDTGPIVVQESVPVLEDDTVESLAARIQECERAAYAHAVRLFAEGRLQIRGRRVHILPASSKVQAAFDRSPARGERSSDEGPHRPRIGGR